MIQLTERKKSNYHLTLIICSIILFLFSGCSRKGEDASSFPQANIGQWISDATIELKVELPRPDVAMVHLKNKTDSALTVEMIRLLSVKDKKIKVLGKIYGCKQEDGSYHLEYELNTMMETFSINDMNKHPLLIHRNIAAEMEKDKNLEEPLLVLLPDEAKEVPLMAWILTAQWSFSGVSDPLQKELSSIQIDILTSDQHWLGPFEIYLAEVTSGIQIYRYRALHDTKDQFSNDIKVIENPANEIVIMTLHSQSKVVSWSKYGGVQVQGNCDNCIFTNIGATRDVYDLFLGVNSLNVSIDINPKVGYTTVVGLKIQDPVVIKNIWQDGTIELNKENVRAVDFKGDGWLSKKKVIGKKAIVFTKV